MNHWHPGGMPVAQLTIGRLLAPIDDPRIAGVVDQLDPINALAEAGAGYVWRRPDESGDATRIHAFDDRREHGSTPVAFTTRHRVEPGDEVGTVGSDRDTCPA